MLAEKSRGLDMANEFDVVIGGGTVYDGNGGDGRRADVGLKSDKVAAMGDLSRAKAAKRIDAKGMAVAPGLIDAHTHSDLSALLAPLAENRLYAGVTTEIGGNCGFAAGPILEEHKAQFLEHYEGLDIVWRTQGEFFSHLEAAGSAVNHAFLVGFGNIRRTAMGGDHARPATRAEVVKMRDLIAAEVDAGAVGISTGLIYPPGCFASKEEIAEAVSAIGGRGLPYATHMRSEGDRLMEAVGEALYIAETADCPLHISHMKANGRRNWWKMDLLHAWWSKRASYRVRVTADRYPYCAGHTGLDSILPQWTYDGGPKEEARRLRDEATWQKIKDEILAENADEDRWSQIAIGAVFHPEHKRFEGMRLSAVASVMGLDPLDVARSLILADDTRTMAMFFSMNEEAMREIFTWDGVVVGSDSSVRAPEGPSAVGFPHPRTFGTTGKILRLLAREEKRLTTAEAVARMTGQVADVFGLKKRGRIAEGYFADVIVFDGAKVADKATYESPSEYTTGIRDVFVNGTAVLEAGRPTGAKPGRVLRNGE
jgi:N-acyl-D-amino-acid deacylase